MARFTLFLALTCLAGLTAAHALRPHDHFVRQRRASRYKLVHDLAAQSVLDFWRFEEKVDASARYVSQEEGKHLGLISVGSYNTVRLGVSTAPQASPRESIRISSRDKSNGGLFILDASHVPVGCGTWAAFWSVGQDECEWPNCGELDFYEAVSEYSTNAYSCHTKDGAFMQDGQGSLFSSSFMLQSDDKTHCSTPATSNQGCGLRDEKSNTAGRPLNEGHGGVWAIDYNSGSVGMWFFPRSAIPADIASANPDPSSWGQAKALFTGCDVKSFVRDQIFVLNTGLCGKWPSETWSLPSEFAGQKDSCATMTGVSTCEKYVANQGEAFNDAYWTINSLKIYQSN